MAFKNRISTTSFCAAVEPALRRIDRWSYEVLRIAGLLVLAALVAGLVAGG